MALNRPAVLVFQEFASLSVTPATPELNVCVVGPAYQLMDYPEDLASQPTLGVYGSATTTTLGATVGVSAAAPAAAVITIPAITNGAVLDTSSIVVTLPSPTVEILASTCTNVINTAVLTVASNPVTAGVAIGDTVWVDVTGGGSALSNKVVAFDATTITLNNQIADTTHTKFRVERTLAAPVRVTPSFTSATTVTLPATMTTAVGALTKTVVSATAFIGYKALRTDLAEVQSLDSEDAIKAALGKYDARNPLCVGAVIARRNTSSSVQVYGIATNDDAGYTNMMARTSSRKDLYAVVPLTQSISVLSSFKTEFNSIADPDYVLTNGLAQKFRVVIGQPGALPTASTIVDSSVGDTISAGSVIPDQNKVITIGSGAWGDSLVSLKILPGYHITYTVAAVSYSYTVASVLSANTLTVDESNPVVGAATVLTFVKPDGVVITPSDQVETLTIAAATASFSTLFDAAATFIDAGVKAGDFIEIPLDSTDALFAGQLMRLEVATVPSNQTVKIVTGIASDDIRDSSLAAYELPHGYQRVVVGGTLSPVDATPLYRIVRTLDGDGQVDALIAAGPGSLNNRRAVAVWPDLVDVADLKDGSLARASLSTATPAAAASQPGYYLACQVGGLTAALPSHHGLTRMNTAGITKLYHSNTLFSDKQLTKLSNNGWMVFQQDVPTALPYIIHGLTTDVTALQFGEFMMVKNLDYVSMVLADSLEGFVGTWNINPETLGFVGGAINASIDGLVLDKKPKIGSRINSGAITQLTPSTVSADRLEVKVEIDFPKPLNTVALHIVSL